MTHPVEGPGTAELIRGRASVGDFELTVLSDGPYFLDGGAMFGVVPKPLWEKRAPADAQNRVLLGLNTVVVFTGRHTVAIETGIGNKLGDKLNAIYGAKQQLPRAFAAAGIRPEDVDIVINTHLHFDHCGWNTTRTPNGGLV
ncbi:MAG TPA: MBL fold metallo-hydrolase, partial [Acidobacteriaceae bacterium]|nr:MBL fold metallo-hydrolase [Acidobacteriaceae bacterium]